MCRASCGMNTMSNFQGKVPSHTAEGKRDSREDFTTTQKAKCLRASGSNRQKENTYWHRNKHKYTSCANCPQEQTLNDKRSATVSCGSTSTASSLHRSVRYNFHRRMAPLRGPGSSLSCFVEDVTSGIVLWAVLLWLATAAFERRRTS